MIQTDIATTRLTRPRGLSWWKSLTNWWKSLTNLSPALWLKKKILVSLSNWACWKPLGYFTISATVQRVAAWLATQNIGWLTWRKLKEETECSFKGEIKTSWSVQILLKAQICFPNCISALTKFLLPPSSPPASLPHPPSWKICSESTCIASPHSHHLTPMSVRFKALRTRNRAFGRLPRIVCWER